ncbi:MAG: amino acid adenylation domain-containing protein [Phenylobacterium sp.]|jgi:amino acid adenylation domain-containing protein
MKIVDLIHHCLSENISLSLNEQGGIDIHAGAEISASTITLLKDHKADLIVYLAEAKNSSAKARAMAALDSTITSGPLDRAPLSYAQQRLLLLDRINGSSVEYNLGTAFRLNGVLNIPLLTEAIQQICQRHSILRTNYRSDEDGEFYQTINQDSVFELSLIDISNSDKIEQDLNQLIIEESKTPFDLSADLMVRGVMIHCGDNDSALLLTIHHIAADGWSRHILCDEMFENYCALLQGRKANLAELGIQYIDFARWQRQTFDDVTLTALTAYWREQLAGIPVQHSLPLDRARPSVPSYQGARINQQLSAATTAALNKLAQANGCTLFMLLHAAFAGLVGQLSNEQDIVIGTPIANREHPQLAPLVGFFVNSLALRTDLSAQPSFTALLQQSKTTLLDAWEHQQAPFENLLDLLQLDRQTNLSPIFQIMIALHNNVEANSRLPGIESSAIEPANVGAKFDIMLDMVESDQGLAISWEYATDIFDATTISGMALHFAKLLAQVIESPELALNGLSLLTKRDITTIETGNDTAVSAQGRLPIHTDFERQAALTPHHSAVTFDNKTLSYQSLDAKANQLAHHLMAQGVGKDTLVGLCVERSELMIIALLAIHKAGGAYVALDPSYPTARLNYMLEDSAASIVIVQSQTKAGLNLEGPSLITLDSLDDLDQLSRLHHLSEGKAGLPAADLTALAYIIYTSGTTGDPKGVMIEHDTLANFTHSMISQPGCAASDTMLSLASLSFDIHTVEIFLPLVTGASIIVAPIEAATSPRQLRRLIDSHHINCLQATPATWQMLLDSGWTVPDNFKMMTGGEALTPMLKQALSQNPSAELWNMYGPTETTVWASVALQGADTDITVGRPIENVQFYVVNDSLTQVPVGTAGELLIAGGGLARGYLNQPELTAEKYTQLRVEKSDESAGQLSVRAYRTGDLVRQLSNGDFVCLGRIDTQVKIRGFRIELGEIEYQLSKLDNIGNVVVIAREDNQGQKRLIAYLMADSDGHEIDIALVRKQLLQSLPEYMIPAAFVLMDAFPVTPNGKTDRKALPQPELSSQQVQYIAPGNDSESQVCAIWQDLLGAERIGISDNFFALGGDSLTLIKLASKLSNIGYAVSVKELHENQTISEFLAQSKHSSYQTLDDLGSDSPQSMPLLPSQLEMLELATGNGKEGDINHWNANLIFEIEPEYFSESLIIKAFELLLNYHDGLKSRIDLDQQPLLSTVHSTADQLPYERITASSDKYNMSSLASCLKDIQLVISLKHRPIQLSWIDIDGGAYMAFTVHHGFFDDVSSRILVEDFIAIYEQLKAGQVAQLPTQTVKMSDYARKLLEYSQSEQVLQHYQRIARLDWRCTATLATDYEGGKNCANSSQHTEHFLSKQHTDCLNQNSLNGGFGVRAAVVAAVVKVFSRLSGSEMVNVAMHHHGRKDLELGINSARLVGFFNDMYVAPFSSTLNSALKSSADADPIAYAQSIEQELSVQSQFMHAYSVLKYMPQKPEMAALFEGISVPEVALNIIDGTDDIEAFPAGVVRHVDYDEVNHHQIWRDGALSRKWKFLVIAFIEGGRVKFQLSYSDALYKRATVHQIGEALTAAMAEFANELETVLTE